MKAPFFPHSPEEIERMLKTIGVSSIDELFQSIPDELIEKEPLNLPPPMSEFEIKELMKRIGKENVKLSDISAFIGCGVYYHFIPSAVKHIVSRSEFYTSYTPYQPEASQGVLQATFEYQTIVCELFNMDIANASMYDGSTALAEACLMGIRLSGKEKVYISKGVHPHYREVVKTYLGKERVSELNFDEKSGRTRLDEVEEEGGVIAVQNPNFFGVVEDLRSVRKACDEKNAKMVVCVLEPLSLGILAPPGDFGCDIAAGEGQSLSLPPSYTGPHLGLFATRKEYVRFMPGRLVGETVDLDGNRGYVLTLSTREQHIRREKATSNICTNSGLNAIAFAISLSLMGKEGFKELAVLNLSTAHYLLKKVEESGIGKLRFSSPFFNEFTVELKRDAEEVWKNLLNERILFGFPAGRFYPELRRCLILTATEVNRKDEIDSVIERVKKWAV